MRREERESYKTRIEHVLYQAKILRQLSVLLAGVLFVPLLDVISFSPSYSVAAGYRIALDPV